MNPERKQPLQSSLLLTVVSKAQLETAINIRWPTFEGHLVGKLQGVIWKSMKCYMALFEKSSREVEWP